MLEKPQDTKKQTFWLFTKEAAANGYPASLNRQSSRAETPCLKLSARYTVSSYNQGGDMASTWIAKPKVHAEEQATS